MSELAKSWPIIGMAALLWLGVVILRTPALGIDAPRVVAITVSSICMITIGTYIERVRVSREQEKKGGGNGNRKSE